MFFQAILGELSQAFRARNPFNANFLVLNNLINFFVRTSNKRLPNFILCQFTDTFMLFNPVWSEFPFASTAFSHLSL